MSNTRTFAMDLPIIDYHNHLSVADISENKRFYDIYDLWIKPDPYKHRTMRMCGVSEKYITGDASDFEKFKAWCSIYPKLIGNPLYVWSQMELEEVFGILELPNENNAEAIYKQANLYLQNNEVTPKSLLNKFNVELACPCVSLSDDVSVFENKVNISPSLRGDDIVSPNTEIIKKLEAVTNTINNLSDYKNAVRKRLDVIKTVGCKFSDHALDNGFRYYIDDGKNEEWFNEVVKDIERSEGRTGTYNQWVIDSLGEYDVPVIDMYDKIYKGTFLGGNLTTAIKNKTKNENGGAVIWGGVRDTEQMKKIDDTQVYYRGIDPTPIREFIMTGFNTVTRIGNAVCLPGDVVFGAGGGVLFIPSHLIEEVVGGAAKTQVKDLFGFEMITLNKFTTAQIDKNTWTKEMLDLLMEFIETDERAAEYRGLDWSLEYDLAINGDPNDTQSAL